MSHLLRSTVGAALLALAGAAAATPSFVNGLALDGAALDLSGGMSVNNGRLGYFSDIYYDPNRREWWGLSDRGPGGGTLSYDTRAQRFTLDLNQASGAISNFRIVETVVFKSGSSGLNGLAPHPTSSLGPVLDLDANTLAALGNQSPEKWEGLAIGPKLANGSYLLLAGTDNDYSASQNGSNTQFDVWFDFSQADPYASSIQCPLDSTLGCLKTANASAATWTANLRLLPGVLHAYTVSAAELGSYTAPVPEPGSWALMAGGLLGLAAFSRRRAPR